MIRLDKTRLGQILSGDFNNIPHSLRVSYQEVYYAMTKVLKKRSPVFDTSLSRWGAKIEQENGYWTSENLSTYQKACFSLHSSLIGNWRQVLYVLIQLMDGVQSRCYLYTLVVRCKQHFWLKWLKEKIHFQPRCIMIDNSDTEMTGIRAAYGIDIQVLICHWHIKRVWHKNVAKKVYAHPDVSVQPKQVRDMLRASTHEDFDLLYDELQLFCMENEGTWSISDIQSYFDQEYLPKEEKWSNTWRQLQFRAVVNNQGELSRRDAADRIPDASTGRRYFLREPIKSWDLKKALIEYGVDYTDASIPALYDTMITDLQSTEKNES
ncbi:hypothetical protein BDA99DRAFT_569841 [Phascolomyces articulosus]|uniref:MULE transposase domain-containing protein n=1 Tax=Phascolomyces articulosus TaxID=60185 RepID=A0AAD5K5H6_9FUNG|nr:hypothetical protein BDA99DRAFT_569841 [Phascolomyces articulosus]